MKFFKNISFIILLVFFLLPKINKSQDLVPKEWRNIIGYWKFQNIKDLTKATVGNNLTLVGTHSWVKGPSYDDTAIRIAVGSYYKCKHNILPNGGGDSVNRYTMMYDFKILSLKKWHTFFQTDTTNSNDGECFIRPNTGSRPGRIGVAATSYTNDSVLPNKWYRLVISVNNGNFYRYYLNGKLILEGDTQDIDDRFALTPKVLFFADENQEDDTIDIASLAIFDTCLSSKDIEKIGTIEPCIAKPPIVNLGNDTNICFNSYITLNAGNNFAKYQWSNGSGLPYTSFIGSSLGLGKKSVWVKVTDKNGCTGGDTINLNVIQVPKSELGSDTSLCEGNKVLLKASNDTNNNFIWKYASNGKIISTKSKVIIDSGGKYLLTITSKAGCITTDSIKVEFYKNPQKPSITLSGNPSFCKGDSVKLTAPAGFTNYYWSNGKQLSEIFISQNSSISLKVSDANNCSSTWSDTVNIKVFENPSAPQISISPDTLFCSGDSVTLSVDKVFKHYFWNTGSFEAHIVVKQSGWFYVWVIDSNNCKSKNSKTVNIFELEVPQKQNIEINGKTEFCQGDSCTLSVKSGFAEYLWNDSNKMQKRVFYQTGNFKIKVKNSNGCFSPWSNEVNMIVNPIPAKPVITTAPTDTLICSVKAENYKWFINSSDLSLNYKNIKANNSGYYKVQVEDKKCWSAMSDSLYYKKASFYNLLKNDKVKVYPNPANDELKIEIIDDNFNISGFYIYNIKGEKILTQFCFTTFKNIISLKTSLLPKGIYIFKIYDGYKLLNSRFEKI